VIGFIDKHLLEDIDFYLQISEVFGTIMRQVRFYPYPSVIYKVELNKYLEGSQPNASISPQAPIVQNTVKPTPPPCVEPAVSVEKKAEPVEKKEEPVEKKAEPVGISNEQLRESVLAKLTKPTMQSNLKDHVMVEKVEQAVVHLVVTNKIAEMLLQNADNKKELETLFTSEL
jgi:hypothetical protein